MLSRSGGNMGEGGSVGWQFKRMAYFELPGNINFDQVFEIAVENGADDVQQYDESIEILAPVESFKQISDGLRNAKIEILEAELRMIPTQETELSVDQSLTVLRTVESLEELDDVQNVFHTLKVSDEVMAALESEE